ncbi:MAG: glycoside hydrolase family 3 C-terminal domain-containing protein [Acidobacteria bacterium]|nr:glycoside hydrolase family 3 C-terminal domain-containing protein [Acidobacteriota bacterium]
MATALLVLLVSSATRGVAQSTPTPDYLDPKQPISRRVDDLLSRMTVEEKVGQLNLPCVYVKELGETIPDKIQGCKRFAAGTQTPGIGPGAGFFTLADTLSNPSIAQQAAYFNELQKIALTQTRLKIPLLQDEEGTHGAMFPGATIFPEGLTMGSTFDMALVQEVYATAAREARAIGIHVLSTLVLELDRDPRMGRNEEAFTEDPFLYTRIAEHIVRGASGPDISAADKTISLMTDFPTQSEPTSGMERGPIDLSERTLRENYLPPWSAAFKEGALGVMAGYPVINGMPEHGSEKWNTEILRDELGFKGFVVSEGYGFQSLIDEHIVPTQKEAGALALRAGVDLNITYEPAYLQPLIDNVKEGKVPMALIDRAVRRVLEAKFRLGLFEHPYVDVAHAEQVVHTKEHQALARRVASEGIVLLKNEKNLLPLSKDLRSIAVIGPNASSVVNLLGDYTAKVIPQHIDTIFQGIQSKVGPGTKLTYTKGCGVDDSDKSGFAAAIQAAKNAQVAVVVVGEQSSLDDHEHPLSATNGESHDVASLDLTGVQEDMVRAIQATGTPVVLVLVNGRPLSIRWEAEHVPAIVEAWLPGEQGAAAVADILFGDANPSGRLAISVPRHVGQLPVYYDQKPAKDYWISKGWSKNGGYVDMPGTPLYPFGFGLSYTQFQYSNLQITPAKVLTDGRAEVRVEVANIGKVAGTETVQLYLHEQYAPVSLPLKQLRGFERVTLEPGQKKTVTFSVGEDDFRLIDERLEWKVVPGTFDIMVGKSSADIVLTGTLEVAAH